MRRRMRRPWTAGATAILAAVVLTACGSGVGNQASDGSNTGSDGKITLSVMGLPPKNQAPNREKFLNRVKEFEKAHPNITIEPSEETWSRQTYATRLAAGTEPTVLVIPNLTDAGALIEANQVADITKHAQQLEMFDSYDPRILQYVTKDDHVYGLPTRSYAIGLMYNRQLFKQAGLEPDDPPTTWDDVRAAAKQITEKTGAIGYAEVTTEGQGGWHVAMGSYAYGGDIETKHDGKYVSSFDSDPTKQFLTLLKQMRWTDRSMGTNQLRTQDDLIKDFAAGRIGMALMATDRYGPYVKKYDGKPEMIGFGAMPQAGANKTLAGGATTMISARASDRQIDAAIKWIDFNYLRERYDTDAAVEAAKADAAQGLPVGVPGTAVFDQKLQDKIDAAIADYRNVPVANFAPFVKGTADLELAAEPPVAGQEVYKTLDTVIQAVLTEKNADVSALLSDAAKKVDAVLRREQ